MQLIATFDELLAKAENQDFAQRQQLAKLLLQPEQQLWTLIGSISELISFAKVNDSLAAMLASYEDIRDLVKNFAQLKELAKIAPETTDALLKYSTKRALITSFEQLVDLLETVELLKITLPPHADIRALIKSPQHLRQLSKIRINTHSNSNLAQLFISYADVRKRFTSFKQLIQFINANPSTAQLFIKDEHTIDLIRNASQLNILLAEFNKLNPLWSQNAAKEFAHSVKISKLLKKETDLLDYLNHFPDQESIQTFIKSNAVIAKLLQPKQSILDMEFFKAKKSHWTPHSIPFSLLQYG